MKFEEKKVDERNEKVDNLHLKPDTSDMILTLDADTVAYAVASVCEAGDDEVGYTLDLKYALAEAISRIENILEHSGCKSVECHFTTGKNFRFTLTDTYKANRSGDRTPAGLYNLKVAILTRYEGIMHINIEADDYVSWQKTFWPEIYIVGSPDKDVYFGNEGVHLNYYKRAKGKYIKEDIPMKWVKTTSEEAHVWTHMQALMGDSGDGIKGIDKCGPVKALKILVPELIPLIDQHKKEFKEEHGKAVASDKLWQKIVVDYKVLHGTTIDTTALWESVSSAYTEAGMEDKTAILNMRLVNMHQMTVAGDIELWTQPIN